MYMYRSGTSSSIKLSRPFNDNDNVNKQGLQHFATLSRLDGTLAKAMGIFAKRKQRHGA